MWLKAFSVISLGVGVFMLVQVMMPVVSFSVWEIALNNKSSALLDPGQNTRGEVMGVSVERKGNFSAFVSDQVTEREVSYSEFILSIPKLKISQAKVVVDTNDFDSNLGHLPGSALPGERGNVFVTGHSSLTQFFREDNYKAIFSNLSNLEKGDEINLNVEGVKYLYVVDGLRVVDPDEVWVVNAPDKTGRYLTLMTCVPPGLSTKRLIVLAKLK